MTVEKECYLITGGTSGVGKAIATDLAKQGLPIILLSRDAGRGITVRDEIIHMTGNPKVRWMALDYNLPGAIDGLVGIIEKEKSLIRVLSHNAALLFLKHKNPVMACKQMLLANVLGPIKLTQCLAQKGLFAKSARVITSAGAPGILRMVKKEIASMPYLSCSLLLYYVRSIFWRVVGFLGLANQFHGKEITINVFHPGGIKTNLLREAPVVLRWFQMIINPFLSTHCPVAVFLAMEPSLHGITGKFYSNSKKPFVFLSDEKIKKISDAIIELAIKGVVK